MGAAASGIRQKKALVSICTTGSGTAKKLEDILTTIVNKASDTPIHILTVSSIKLANSIKEIEKEYEILATVGTKDPKINAPHVSLEVLIEGGREADSTGDYQRQHPLEQWIERSKYHCQGAL